LKQEGIEMVLQFNPFASHLMSVSFASEQALVNTVMNLWVHSIQGREFLD